MGKSLIRLAVGAVLMVTGLSVLLFSSRYSTQFSHYRDGSTETIVGINSDYNPGIGKTLAGLGVVSSLAGMCLSGSACKRYENNRGVEA